MLIRERIDLTIRVFFNAWNSLPECTVKFGQMKAKTHLNHLCENREAAG